MYTCPNPWNPQILSGRAKEGLFPYMFMAGDMFKDFERSYPGLSGYTYKREAEGV